MCESAMEKLSFLLVLVLGLCSAFDYQWEACHCIDNVPTCSIGLEVLHLNASCDTRVLSIRRNRLKYFSQLKPLHYYSKPVNNSGRVKNEGDADLSHPLLVLDVSINWITTFPPFPDVGSLIILNVANNYLDSISESFSRYAKLQALNIGGNRFKKFNSTVFFGLKSLRVLQMSRNPLTILQPEIFSQLSNLEVLSVSGTQLVSLPEGTFTPLRNLWYLDLSENKLMFLRRDIFSALGNLQILYLQGNNLRILIPGVFRNQRRLMYLDLGSNRLTRIRERSLMGLEALWEINLSNNSLRELPPLAAWYPRLRAASLDNNSIARVSAKDVLAAACGHAPVALSLAGNPLTRKALCWTSYSAHVVVSASVRNDGGYRMVLPGCQHSTVEFDVVKDNTSQDTPDRLLLPRITSINATLYFIEISQHRGNQYRNFSGILPLCLLMLIPFIALYAVAYKLFTSINSKRIENSFRY